MTNSEPIPPIQDAAVPAVSALEVDFPSAHFSTIAEAESWRKEIHRPATSTHKWWAKRLGTVFRALISASLTTDALSAIDLYSNGADLDRITVYDPFAGSGVTVVEALKLNARAVASDINPVATLVQRQAVQRWSLPKLTEAFESIELACKSRVDTLYKTDDGEDVLYYFWVAYARCLECDREVNLFSNPVFSRNAYPSRKPLARAVCPECLAIFDTVYDFERERCPNGHLVLSQGAVSGRYVTCPSGHTCDVLTSLRGERPTYRQYAKIVLTARGHKEYRNITAFDNAHYADIELEEAARSLYSVLPDGKLEDGYNTRQAIRWGFQEWTDFFNARQMKSLGIIASSIRALPHSPEREAMAALFSGTLEFNNMFCSFKGEGTGAVRHMFSNHVLKPERTPLEAHPWGRPQSSGSFSTLFKSRVLRAAEHKKRPTDLVASTHGVERRTGISRGLERRVVSSWELPTGPSSNEALLWTGDAATSSLPDESVDLIVTDPPYMDNVHYSELADFFHSWLREIEPFEGYCAAPKSTRQTGEVQSPSPAEFGRAIEKVWCCCERILKADGLMAFTFHQARISGWIEVVRALHSAGFIVTAVQPIKGEMSSSVTKSGREPSNLDSIVVCRKRSANGIIRRGPDKPADAADRALSRLRSLRQAGTKVGTGDVRSVVRGEVLACYTKDGESTSLATLADVADQYADWAIEEFSR